MEVSLHVPEPIPDQERLAAIVDEVAIGERRPTKPWVLRLEPEHRLSDEAFGALRMLVGSLSEESPAYSFYTLPLTLTCGLSMRGDQVRLFQRDSEWSDETVRVARIADACSSAIVLHADGGEWPRAANRTCNAVKTLENAMDAHDCEDVRFAHAAALIDMGQHASALQVLAKVGRRGAVLRAHAHMRVGKPGRALHALRGIDEPLLEAQVRMQLRDWDGARERLGCARAIPLHALMSIDDLQAHTLLAEHDLIGGDADRALATARTLTAVRPDHAAGWFLLFDALARSKPSELDALLSTLRETPGAAGAVHLIEVALGCARASTPLGEVIERRRASEGVLLSCLSFPWLLDPDTGLPVDRPRAPKVSLTMIVRDEEENLGDCLEGVVELADEMVIVDTGSSDATRDIARHFGAKVTEFEWCDDFSAARNAALDRARGEWIFVLDADDRILDRDQVLLRALFERLPADDRAFCMHRVSLATDGHVGSEIEQALLFRRSEDVRWRYRVHEQITPALLQRDVIFTSTDIRIIHTGYRDAATLAAKAERNFRIVQKELADRPEDPFLNFSLGMMLVDQRRHSEALEPLRRSESATEPQTEMSRSLAIALTRCLLAAGRKDEALATIHVARVENSGHAPVALAEAEILVGRGQLDDAAEALADLPFDANTKFDVHHARALMLLGELMIQRGHYERAGVIGRTLIESRRTFGGGWLVLADAHLARGERAALDDLVQRVAALRDASELRAILSATSAVARGAFDDAVAVLTGKGPLASVVASRAAARSRVPFATCCAAPWSVRECT